MSIIPRIAAAIGSGGGGGGGGSTAILELLMNEAAGTTVPTDTGSGLHTLTRNGTPIIAVDAAAPPGVSCSFDGTGDFYTIANTLFTITGTFTFEAHVKWVSGNAGIVGWTGAGAEESGFYVASDGRIAFKFSSSANINGGSVPANTRTHVAVTRDSSDVTRIFIGGTIVASATATFSSDPVVPTSSINIGRIVLGGTNRDFNGNISNLRFYTSCLYTASFTPDP